MKKDIRIDPVYFLSSVLPEWELEAE